MEEKEIIEVLKNKTEEIEIPESLLPNNIIAKLGERASQEVELSIDVIEASKRPKSKVKRALIYSGIAVAAIIALVVTVLIKYGRVIVEKETNGFYKISNFDNFENYVRVQDFKENFIGFMSILSMGGNGPGDSGVKMSSGSIDFSEDDYSDTNVRTEGILESDCTKTDGKYIYMAGISVDGLIRIAEADGKNTEYVSEYNINEMISKYLGKKCNKTCFQDIVLYKDKLIIIGTNNYEAYIGEDEFDDETIIVVMDKRDVKDIKLEKCFTVSGVYNQCRVKDGYLYVVSQYDVNLKKIQPETNGKKIDVESIYVNSNRRCNDYIIVSSYDIDGDEIKIIDSKATLISDYIEIYASENNMYLFDSGDKLNIMKFSYDEGKITPIAAVEIYGWLEDVFCADEYNEYFRIVITKIKGSSTINTLYVFDRELKEVGIIDDIAPGESVYSARFAGDIGYFVTYEEIDPLFSVDLSNPYEPKIIGQLKIPGFSSYLHMWDSNMLFGLGEDDAGMKLSMFDIANPYNVTEESKMIIEGGYISSGINHKAIMINYEKNVIGFGTKVWCGYRDENDKLISDEYDMYYICSYENNRFVEKIRIPLELNTSEYSRGMFIGDYIYVVDFYDDIYVISMDDYSVVATVYNNSIDRERDFDYGE